jgi:hypothetical protein
MQKINKMVKNHSSVCIHEDDWGMVKQKLLNGDDRMVRLESDIKEIKSDIKDVKESLTSLPEKYVTRSEFSEFKGTLGVKEKSFKDKAWQVFIIALPWIALFLFLGFKQYLGN